MSELSQLSPQPLWQIFADICAIPHPSYHEEALAAHIMDWAAQRGIHAERDAVGNILLRKPASRGMEKRIPVVLQAHLDMVPQKNNDTRHDFINDPIQAYVDGDWVKAHGTTLGSDNGIGMASALAVLADDSLQHGPLEVLLTMTEEVGMDGAFGLQPNWLQGEILINTDSEEEGEIYMGCAGGIDVITTLTLQREALSAELCVVRLSISGLKGGHSGGDIHLGLGNANRLLGRFLAAHAEALGARVLDINGGTLRNAIPREAFATLALPTANRERLQTLALHFQDIIRRELSAVEKHPSVTVEHAESPLAPLDAASQARLIALLNSTPNGVIRMSDEVKGVVETSLNLGVVTTQEDEAQIICLIRSLNESGKDALVSQLISLGSLAAARVEAKGSYPGWEPDADSAVMHLVRDTYHMLFGTLPNIMVIHAGLECGLFKKPYPQMDMVSIGPTITGPHSPDEQVNIPSVGRYWQLLTALLKAIPEKA